MNELSEVKRKRFIFMKRLYELSGASPIRFVPEKDILEGTEIDKTEATGIAQYLKGKGLLKYAANGPTFTITTYGIDKVEKAMSNPREDTQYFGPVLNILNIGSADGAQIQQGTTNSSQDMQIKTYDTDELRELVKSMTDKIDELHLLENDEKLYLADLRTIEAQIDSPRPKSDVIGSCLRSLKNILENAAGSAAAVGLIKLISTLIG